MEVISKRSGYFVINESCLTVEARTPAIKNALYADVYVEFLGAVENPKYKDFTILERFNKLNEFATSWLKNRGYLNEN